jgi:hypothetical protein
MTTTTITTCTQDLDALARRAPAADDLLSLETIADLDADFVFNNYYGSEGS